MIWVVGTVQQWILYQIKSCPDKTAPTSSIGNQHFKPILITLFWFFSPNNDDFRSAAFAADKRPHGGLHVRVPATLIYFTYLFPWDGFVCVFGAVLSTRIKYMYTYWKYSTNPSTRLYFPILGRFAYFLDCIMCECDNETSFKNNPTLRQWTSIAKKLSEKVSEWEKSNLFIEPSSKYFLVISKFLCNAPPEIDGKMKFKEQKAIQRVRVPLRRYLLKCIEHSTLMDLILVRINLSRKISENTSRVWQKWTLLPVAKLPYNWIWIHCFFY